jgi:uncharacterized glyoxalase superfamily protein PhnB
MAKTPMIILYVSDQERSNQFYEAVLQAKPILDVPGMTEFRLQDNFLLGLMPESSIAKIICPEVPVPASGNGIPRCELYLFVEDPARSLENAITAGAKKIADVKQMGWGDIVAYCADPDGHVLAFAK